MSEPFLGQLGLFSFNFAPKGWAMCNGQLLPISQNQALFSLLGTFYGGDGRVNFALPNLQSRCPMHVGNGHTQGESGGAQAVTLTLQQLPTHTHNVNASSAVGNQANPKGNFWAQDDAAAVLYRNAGTDLMNGAAIASVGGSQAHNNMAPYLVISFCIALQGIYPSRN